MWMDQERDEIVDKKFGVLDLVAFLRSLAAGFDSFKAHLIPALQRKFAEGIHV